MGGSSLRIAQWSGGGRVGRPIGSRRGVGGLAGAKSDPGKLKAESARHRALGAASWLSNAAGAQGVALLPQFTRQREREKGEIRLVAQLGPVRAAVRG